MVNPSAPETETLYEFVPDESFRDSIGTLDERGKRRWIFPKKITGFYTRARSYVAYVLLAVFFVLPFVQIQGQPFLLLNFLERRFVLFGQPFWPQDFYILVFVFLSTLVALAAFTVAFGRLFCGWICPQTIFQEFVFRKIEYWIDGDSAQARALDKAPLTGKKLQKRILKHTLFVVYSIVMGHWFLMYIIGYPAVRSWVAEGPLAHLPGTLGMLAFSGAYYLVFTRFREQVCIVACPYGRLQGVLLDNNSIVIAYDFSRGEPRGKLRKGVERTEGDCIDCYQCVQVCPTGIDIRNGTQLECINCTLCIDACDNIMDRIGKPRGLIRYASQNQITARKPFRFTGRMAFYSVVVSLLIGVFFVLIYTRTPVQLTVLRQPGTLFQVLDNGHLSNVYQYGLVNKTLEEKILSFRLISPAGNLRVNSQADTTHVAAQEARKGMLVLELDKAQITGRSTPVVIEVRDGAHVVDRVRTTFVGPIPSPGQTP